MPDDQKFIDLIKTAACEGQFDKLSTNDIIAIYRRGASIARYRPYDDALNTALMLFERELKSRMKYTNRFFVNKVVFVTIILLIGIVGLTFAYNLIS